MYLDDTVVVCPKKMEWTLGTKTGDVADKINTKVKIRKTDYKESTAFKTLYPLPSGDFRYV